MGENLSIAIVFLDRNGFDFFTPLQESTIRFNLPQEIFRDMEIIDNDQFLSQIKSFIATYTISPSSIFIAIANSLLFIKDIQTAIPSQEENTPPRLLSPIEQQKQIQSFLDSVPFELVESKTYPIEGGVRVVATNKAIYDQIRIGFENEGSIVKAVVPALVVSSLEEADSLNENIITNIMNANDKLSAESLTIRPEEPIILSKEEKKKEFLSLPKKQNKLYAMGGGFLILILLLGFLVKQMLDSNAADLQKGRDAKQAAAQSTPVATQSTPTTATTNVPLSNVAPTGNTANKAQVKIAISTSSTTATQGQLIKNKLTEKGYTNITMNTASSPATAKTLIIFSSTLNNDIQQDVTQIVQNIFTNFSSQTNTQTQYDITIIPSNNL